MLELPVTSIIAAIAAVALVGLSLPVSLRRARTGVVAGDGGDETLRRLIRTQGNFIEYAPVGLIVLGLAEAGGAAAAALWTVGGLLVGGRTSHAVGMMLGSTPLRAAGMLATYGALLYGASILVI